jgi:hypothetical protein
VRLAAAVAYGLLVKTLLDAQGPGSLLEKAVGSDFKGKLSPVLYALAIPCAFVRPWIADTLFVAVALVWLIPDARIERTLAQKQTRRPQKKRTAKQKTVGPAPGDPKV